MDIIVQNSLDIERLGSACATRFDLDKYATLPWNEPYFGCWTDYHTPIIGSLTEPYIRDYAYKIMLRKSATGE